MVGVIAWVFTWWITEAVPLPVTSMCPLFLFPMFGISSADTVAHSYMDDVIALVLGSFILALAVERYNVTLVFCGDPLNPAMLLLGLCATTFFVSMWLQNVITAVMMMPVATGILHQLPPVNEQSELMNKFNRAVILTVVYATQIGGMSTITGTGIVCLEVLEEKTIYKRDNGAVRALVGGRYEMSFTNVESKKK
ncbi:hypothetical protein TSUD_379520 [Trifolium subterraneum]|uniref:Citrate transporter-like domain-containing protein n=1 Tax=Trifolium subterraneum TaxID=3900 RepID=A0A2Z6MYH8_TRISU|nr:hypothetical protein TSUD_379520 [Trifolium subterraneum]